MDGPVGLLGLSMVLAACGDDAATATTDRRRGAATNLGPATDLGGGAHAGVVLATHPVGVSLA